MKRKDKNGNIPAAIPVASLLTLDALCSTCLNRHAGKRHSQMVDAATWIVDGVWGRVFNICAPQPRLLHRHVAAVFLVT